MKYTKNIRKIIVLILLCFPIAVNANITCNDGTISPTCSSCNQGCCSKHGGCADNSDSISDSSDYESDNAPSNNDDEPRTALDDLREELGLGSDEEYIQENIEQSLKNAREREYNEDESKNKTIFLSVIIVSIIIYFVYKKDKM